MVRVLMRNNRGVLLAAVIVAVNFAVALHLTGLSYGRYDWTAFAVSYGTATADADRDGDADDNPRARMGRTVRPPPQCASTFCVDGVCCDTICDQVNEFCNLPGSRESAPVPRVPAPALQGVGLFVAVLLLVAVGALAFRRRRPS